MLFLAVMLPLGLWHPIRNYILFAQPIGYVAPISVTSQLYIGGLSLFERIGISLGNIHSLIKDGEVAQFNNILVQFELLEKVSDSVLTYKKYEVPVVMKFSDLGGASEDEGEFALEMAINGKGTVVNG